MLEAVSAGIFSNDYYLTHHGALVAHFDMASMRERADVLIAGGKYQLFREGMVSGDFCLAQDGVVLARAHKPGAFSSTFDVRFHGMECVLRKVAVWSREFGVFQGEQQVGIITRPLFSRRVQIVLPDEWPLPAQVFLFFLARIIWRRSERASASS